MKVPSLVSLSFVKEGREEIKNSFLLFLYTSIIAFSSLMNSSSIQMCSCPLLSFSVGMSVLSGYKMFCMLVFSCYRSGVRIGHWALRIS